MNNIVSPENRPIACVILPTYNEVANISIIVPKIFAQQAKISTHLLHILVVDDNSPDAPGFFQAHMFKMFSAVTGFIYTVSNRDIAADESFACTGPYDIGV